LQYVEPTFFILVSIRHVLAYLHSRQTVFGILVQTSRQLIRFCFANRSPRFPTTGRHPITSITGSIAVDRNKYSLRSLILVCPTASLCQWNIYLLLDDTLSINAILP